MGSGANFRILTLNSISAHGLKRFPASRYTVGADVVEAAGLRDRIVEGADAVTALALESF